MNYSSILRGEIFTPTWCMAYKINTPTYYPESALSNNLPWTDEAQFKH